MTTARRTALQKSANSDLYSQVFNLLPDTPVGLTGWVESLHVAPIKALGMLDLQCAKILPTGMATEDGLVHDRGTMLAIRKPGQLSDDTDYDWQRFSQREAPMLAMTRMTYDPATQLLTLSGPNMEPLEFHQSLLDHLKGAPVVIRLSTNGDTLLLGIIQENVIINWVRRYLQKNGYKGATDQIVFLRREHDAAFAVDGEMHQRGHPAMTLFSDGDPVHVTNAETLSWMMRWLRNNHNGDFRNIPMRNFRPNIVLKGLPAVAEDVIRTIEFDGEEKLPFVLTCDCVRCAVTMIDAVTGTKPDGEPLTWLTQHRPHREDVPNKPTFGYNSLFHPMAYGKVLTVDMKFVVTEAQ